MADGGIEDGARPAPREREKNKGRTAPMAQIGPDKENKGFWQTVRAGLGEIASEIGDKKADWEKAAERRRLENQGKTGVRTLRFWLPLLLLLAIAIVYCIVIGRSLDVAHIDIGDGNYLYTSARMADGLRIYRDFLSPQPPLHLLTGSMLIRLGRLLERAFGEPAALAIPLPLLTVRIFEMTLHLLTMGLVFLLGKRLTQTPYGGVIAALIFMLLPIGIYWRIGYQSEPLEIFFLLASLWFFLPLRPRPMLAAGALMSLSVLTNMTAAPYAIACAFYLAVRHGIQQRRAGGWRLVLCYVAPLAGIWLLVAAWFEIRTGAFFQNVIFNQVASYPPWGYALRKLAEQTAGMFSIEGGYVLLALLGLALYNRTDTRPEREFFVWYALAMLLSIVYTTKGGTMDYIFTIGEPAVALFAAYFVTNYFYPSTFRRFFQRSPWLDTSAIPQAIFLLLLILVIAWPGARFGLSVLRHEQVEQNAEGVMRLSYIIRRHSEERQPILCLPYYAFFTNRLLVEEYAELYLWSIKYQVETKSGKPADGVAKVKAIEQRLRAREVPIVVANVNRPMILLSREIRSAIETFYKPLLKPEEPIRTRNFELQVYVPKTDEELAANPVQR